MAIGMVLLSTLIALLSAGITAFSGGGFLSILASYFAASALSFLLLISLLVAKELLLCRHSSRYAQMADEPPSS